MTRKLAMLLAVLGACAGTLVAGTTGKIAGRVTDAQTNEPLPGVNVVLEGTTMGAATDAQGRYVILNVPPGTYVVHMTMMGYKRMRLVEVRVSVDHTTEVNAQLEATVLLGETVTVTAERPLIQMDATSSRAVVAAEQIQQMPVDNFFQVLELQAGVVRGSGGEIHIRGGRAGEVAYLVDGISVTDGFNSSMAVSVENNAIQELELVSGTFNAEYGQAMSGVVNIVTKEGASHYSGEASVYLGDYVSRDTSIFYHIDDVDPLAIVDARATLSGPIPGLRGKATFFLSGRYYDSDGYLYGIRRYMPADSNDFSNPDPSKWHIEQTGDNKPVAMNPYEKLSGQIKLAYTLRPSMKLTYNLIGDDITYQTYSHAYKLNPDGRPTNYTWSYSQILTWTHTLSPTTFYSLKYSNFFNDYKSYVYKNPLQKYQDPDHPGYVHPNRFRASSGYMFYSGGTNMNHYYRNTTTHVYKGEVVSQVHRAHQLKGGFEYRWNKIFLDTFTILLDQSTNYLPQIPDITSPAHDRYRNYPKEFSAYLQDKIELKEMIVNVGVRFELFEPDGRVLTDPQDPNLWLPNKYALLDAVTESGTIRVKVPVRIDPASGAVTYINPNTGEPLGATVKDIRLVDVVSKNPRLIPGTATLVDPATGAPIQKGSMPWFKKASKKYQISPRVGIAYPITDRGVIHFSYGHFLQIPAYSYLYANPEFEVTSGFSTYVGNANLEPQRTTSYEMGLQQQLSDDIAINITGFYKDVRNLLGTKIIETYSRGDMYGLYINRDYGNVRGITFSLTKRPSNYVAATLDYTYSVAEGNASDPEAAFQDAASNREPEKQMVYLDWDQPHTLNASVTIGDGRRWAVSLIGQYGSGLPYTPMFRGIRTAIENSERKPTQYNLDLRANYDFYLRGLRLSLFCNVYNLLDRRNEDYVYSDTGRATYTLIPTYTGEVHGPNTLEEYLVRPDFYSSPREVKVGLGIGF